LNDGKSKQCSKCKVLISVSRKDTYCIECRKEYNRAWERKNREQRRECRQLPENKKKNKKIARLKKYGLTLDQWNQMREDQKHKCLICHTHEKDCQQETLCVDHCHSTGKVRGLLCHNCNRGIGLMNDCPENVKRALEYLSEVYTK